jgi:hypothetical protein
MVAHIQNLFDLKLSAAYTQIVREICCREIVFSFFLNSLIEVLCASWGLTVKTSFYDCCKKCTHCCHLKESQVNKILSYIFSISILKK